MSSAAFVIFVAMLISPKRSIALFLAISLLIVIGIGMNYSCEIYRQVTQREVWFDANVPQTGAEGEPVSVLIAAVAKDQLSARFKVRWNDSAFGTHFEGWMLYDRRKSTLQFDDTVRDEMNNSHAAYSFTGVNDEILANLSNTSFRLFNLPKLLPKFGCHIHKITDVTEILQHH